MRCYREGGCGPYEMRSCLECPYSKPQNDKIIVDDYLQVIKDKEKVAFDRDYWKMKFKQLQADLQRYKQAEDENRLVIFDEPRLPLVWGDLERDTILCPNCERDLMGGYPYDENVEMCQCYYCGQPIDVTKAIDFEAAEAALVEGKE